ncbi:MAG: hypothetical protein IMF07_06020 [Proteobacteria bacterium]|nr:hypothetical protein [Pseudomonadota bacterium]
MRKFFTCLAVFLVLALFMGVNPPTSSAADDENCLMCHKYRKMGIISPEGVRKYYYVDEPTFMQTVHSRVPCRDCHYFIKQIPHKPVNTGVTCDTKCHVINPATMERFSHKPIADVYEKSVHGRAKRPEGEKGAVDKNKPYCIFCHINPIYNPEERETGLPKEITDRCNVCHENEEFAKHWYMHTSRRVRDVKRQGTQIVELCNTCHKDENMLEEQEMLNEALLHKEMGKKFTFAGESYDESFHAKVTKYGLKGAATCVDCHVDSDNYYMAVHDIRNSSDPSSPVHPDNRVNTCKKCHYHGEADESFVNVDPHPTARLSDNPFIFYASIIYNIIAYTAFFGLVGLKMLETVGRLRDGVKLTIRNGSSWRRGLK